MLLQNALIKPRRLRSLTVEYLLFFGSVQLPEDCHRNPYCSEADNVTQLSLMQAFVACGVKHIDVLSIVGTSAWKGFRLVHGETVELTPEIRIHRMPFVSFGPLQPLSQAMACVWHLAKHMLTHPPDAIIVNLHLARYGLPALITHALSHIPVVAILSDTPPFQGKDWLYRPTRILEWLVVHYVPGAVVFSGHVRDRFRPNRPTIRMVLPPFPDLLAMPESLPNPDTRVAYFAGTTAEVSGADLLLKAIQHIHDPTYSFWFSGRGPLDEAIREEARSDKRITHWGFVSREQYRELLQQANVLVNPRPTRLPENRYNFPSKLMEYMAAGRPIISTATSDIAEHYLGEIVLLEDETPEGLARLICEVCAWPLERKIASGEKARARVRNETWEAQAQRILGFIESLSRGAISHDH